MAEKKFLQQAQSFGKTKFGKKFLAQVKTALASGQSPGVFLISCSDSRVLPSKAAQPGEVFQYNNVAEIVSPRDPNFGASLEYFVNHLKGKNVVVLGHADCGGMKALHGMGRGQAHGKPDIYVPLHLKKALDARAIRDKLVQGKGLAEADKINLLIELNALMQKGNIEVMLAGMGAKGVKVHAWMYQHDGSFGTEMKTLSRHGLAAAAARLLAQRKQKVAGETARYFQARKSSGKPKAKKKAAKRARRGKR